MLESECIFSVRKELTTYYKSWKADKYQKPHKIQKKNTTFFINELAENPLCYIPPTFFVCILSDCLSIGQWYYNMFNRENSKIIQFFL